MAYGTEHICFPSSRKSVIPLAPFDGVLTTQFLAIATAALKLLRSPCGASTHPLVKGSNSEATGKENTFDGLRD